MISLILLSKNEEIGDPELITRDFISIKSIADKKKLPRYPRASALYTDCMRKLVLINKHQIQDVVYNKFHQNIVFSIGNAVHSWAQNTKDFISDDFRRGFWRCRACGHISKFSAKINSPCPECSAKKAAFEYFEYPLKLEKPLYMTGHPDMFVEKPENNFRIMEFKTINGSDFDKLKAPLIEHVWQIHAYMWGINKDRLGKSIRFDKTHGYIMYISKDMKINNSPVKTFIIKREPSIERAIISKLKEFKEGYEKDIIPPPCNGCLDSSFLSYTSKNCPAVNFCKKDLTNS